MDGAGVREDHLERAQRALDGAVPQIDYHMHTTWTDGADSAAAMHEAATTAGLDAVLFSEHARVSSEDWFHDFVAEIRALARSPCRALVGVEAKVVDFAGAIDSTAGILAAADLVMASVHRFPGEKRTGDAREFDEIDPKIAIATERRLMLAALDNPAVDILGHPFGVSRNRFKLEPSEDDWRRVIEKAAKTRVAFEINSYYHPDPWTLIRWCREADARISLGSNAHRSADVGAIVRALARGQG